MLIIYFKYLAAILKMVSILDFFKVAPRLRLKVRLHAIMMRKMVLLSNVVTIWPIFVAKPPHYLRYTSCQSSELKVRHDFFSLHIVDLWNSLPESVVSALSINSYKTSWTSIGMNTNSVKILKVTIRRNNMNEEGTLFPTKGSSEWWAFWLKGFLTKGPSD